MDYFDEYDDGRPRVLFRSGGAVAAVTDAADGLSKPHLAACFSSSILLSLLAYYAFHFSYQILFSLLIWFALSLLLAPFAPSSATGGSISVGRGAPLPELEPSIPTVDPVDSSSNRRSRSRKQADKSSDQIIYARSSHDTSSDQKRSEQKAPDEEDEEREWTQADLNLLKKQMAKYNVAGDPNRWEKIATPFKGRHGLESVIHTVKSLQGRKTTNPQDDPFEDFLKKRKPINPQAESETATSETNVDANKESWSSSDDLALLNALKAFPKDVSMRWEKIVAAVPGKSKAGCMKRVSELKKDFRSMKATES